MHPIRVLCLMGFVFGGFFYCEAASPDESRVWTTLKGHKMKAVFHSVVDGAVVLESEAGKKVKIKPESLSMQDRLVLKDWGEAEGPDSLRCWTSQGGKSVVGMIKRFEGDLVVFDLGGREVRLRRDKLANEDRVLVEELQAARAEKMAAEKAALREAMMKNPFGAYEPGRMIGFDMPVRDEIQAFIKKEKLEGFESIKMVIGLPADFDPFEVYPIVIVQITSSTKNGTCASAAWGYSKVGMEENCIVMGVSAPKTLSSETYEYRNAMAEEGLRVLYESMPQAKSWPIYFAGFSGGAKYSGSLANMMAANGYPISGVFMAGCNEDTVSSGYDSYKPGKAFKKTPMFLSNGNEDNLASFDRYGKYLQDSMEDSGFKNVRAEMFEGKHEVSQAHFREALQWFRAFGLGAENP